MLSVTALVLGMGLNMKKALAVVAISAAAF
jgi:hypothetical protein